MPTRITTSGLHCRAFNILFPKLLVLLAIVLGAGEGEGIWPPSQPFSSKADGFKASPTLLRTPSLLSWNTRWEQPQARMPHFQGSYLKFRKTFLVINDSHFVFAFVWFPEPYFFLSKLTFILILEGKDLPGFSLCCNWKASFWPPGILDLFSFI